MKYKNWSDGEPKDVDDEAGCVSMSAKSEYTWSISECSTEMCFICQKKREKGQKGKRAKKGEKEEEA